MHVAGIPEEYLQPGKKEYPCPRCSPTDSISTRFRMRHELHDKPLYCSHCFRGKGGNDIIAAVMHYRGAGFQEALRLLNDYLDGSSTGCRTSISTQASKTVPMLKNERNQKPDQMKPELLRTIPYEYVNGAGDCHVKIERLEFADGSKSFRQSHWDMEQRRYVSGKGCMDGVGAVPWDAPSFKEASTVYWCEGEKKTVALAKVMEQHRPEICCSCKWGGCAHFPQELIPWFRGKDVVIFADNDEALDELGQYHDEILSHLRYWKETREHIERTREIYGLTTLNNEAL
jgi:hypothetical protein